MGLFAHARRPRILALIGLVVALGVTGGGTALAFWSAGGDGAGAGASGTMANLTLSAGTPTASLYPGGQTSVVLTVTNPNDAAVHISSLSLNTGQGTGGFAADAGHSGCSVAALSYTTQTNGGSGWNVPARVGLVDGTLSVTLANALAMTTSAANACQGATFTVYLAAG